MRSSRHLTRAFFAAVIALAPVTASADQKDDLYRAADSAYNSGKAVEANDGFCKVAALDANYKDAAKRCEDTKKDAQTVINSHNKRFVDALQAIQENRFDDAEKLLQQVKYGPRVASVAAQMQRITELRQKKAQADAATNAAAANNARVEQGVQAFNRGDFGTAKANLPPGHELIGRISQYETRMADGQRALASKDYANALVAFGQAAAIAGNGPGDPNGQIRNVQQLMASGTGATTTPTKAAVRDEVKKVDEASYIAQAEKLIAKKDYKRARRFLNDVIAQNFRNTEAADLLKSLPEEERSGSSPIEEDPVLAAAINDYYAGNFSDAEARLQNYVVQSKPPKPGLSRFYLGAIQATQYFLGGGENGGDAKLLQEAKRRFREAKSVDGFVPPTKYMSPKIMRLYESAS
jgi:hypothetical protein